jgi:hypothetical protein
MGERTAIGAAILAAGLFAGCGGPIQVAAPPVVVSSDQEAIWVTRMVEVPTTDGPRMLGGLFACYRPPAATPGAPACYLSTYVWSEKDLPWPSTGTGGPLAMTVVPAAPVPAPPPRPVTCMSDSECDPGERCAQGNGHGYCARGLTPTPPK